MTRSSIPYPLKSHKAFNLRARSNEAYVKPIIKVLSFLAFGFMASCNSNTAPPPPENGSTIVKGIASLQATDLQHLVLIPKDAYFTLSGFTLDGKLMSSDVLYPNWLLPQSVIELKAQNLIIVQVDVLSTSPTKNELPPKTDTGYEVLKDCAGLVVFSLTTSKSDCFDHTLGAKSAVSYAILQESPSTEALGTLAAKTTRTATGRTVEQVLRSADGTLTAGAISTLKGGEEFVGQAKNLLVFKALKATNADPYAPPQFFADLRKDDQSTSVRRDLDASQIISFSSQGFTYISKDRQHILYTSATVDPQLVDQAVCDIKLDDQNKPLVPSASLIDADIEGDTSKFLNSKGQILRITKGRDKCEVTNLKVNNFILDAKLKGDLLVFRDQAQGLSAKVDFDDYNIPLLPLYSITSFSIDDDSKAVFYVGHDASDQLVSGKIDASQIRSNKDSRKKK